MSQAEKGNVDSVQEIDFNIPPSGRGGLKVEHFFDQFSNATALSRYLYLYTVQFDATP